METGEQLDNYFVFTWQQEHAALICNTLLLTFNSLYASDDRTNRPGFYVV